MLKEKARKFWCGDAPKSCSVCDRPIKDVFIDGRTQWGPWGFMCPCCHSMHGEGLGTGRGQMYQRQTDARWLKIEPETEHPVDRQPAVDPLVALLLDQIANDDFIDYAVTHDGELDNPLR